MNHDQGSPDQHPSFWHSRYAIGLVVLGAVAAYFLLTEHRAHFFGALPYLLLTACPLMHLFMHGGHGHHSHHRDDGRAPPQNPSQQKDDRPPGGAS